MIFILHEIYMKLFTVWKIIPMYRRFARILRQCHCSKASSQKGYFCARREPLGEVRAACEKQAKAKGELYLKLGLLAGLAFVILII